MKLIPKPNNGKYIISPEILAVEILVKIRAGKLIFITIFDSKEL
jgi:hypothetical protein